MQVFGFGFVTGKLPQCFIKPDIWHLNLYLDVQRSFLATLHLDTWKYVNVNGEKDKESEGVLML